MQQANSINQQTAQLHRSELHDDHHDGMWQVVWCKDSWHDIANRLVWCMYACGINHGYLTPQSTQHRVRARLPSWAELVVVDDSIPVCEQVANAHVIIPTTGIVDATVINNASHLRLITQPATAHHNIAVDVATARGIPVCTAPGILLWEHPTPHNMLWKCVSTLLDTVSSVGTTIHLYHIPHP